jgi:hypothetical protein
MMTGPLRVARFAPLASWLNSRLEMVVVRMAAILAFRSQCSYVTTMRVQLQTSLVLTAQAKPAPSCCRQLRAVLSARKMTNGDSNGHASRSRFA